MGIALEGVKGSFFCTLWLTHDVANVVPKESGWTLSQREERIERGKGRMINELRNIAWMNLSIIPYQCVISAQYLFDLIYLPRI